jgi:hypothetical protein
MTWVHLPKSLYSQGPAEDSSPLNTSLDGTPSVMSSGTGTQSKSLRPGSGTATSTMPPSGTTPLLSTEDHGADLWILSLQDFRVNRSQQPGKDLPSTTLAMAGLPPSESFAKYDPESHGWKTFQVSLLSLTLEPYSGSWPKRGIAFDGIAYRLRKLARRIFAKDFGLLPTPTAQQGGYQRSPGSSNIRYSLVGMARRGLWPTPTAGDSKDRTTSQKSRAAKSGPTLLEKVRMFGTPGTRGIDGSKHQREAARKRGTFVTHNGGKLNPMWVEWLMGWPLGWTDLKPLETARFQEWLEKHGGD